MDIQNQKISNGVNKNTIIGAIVLLAVVIIGGYFLLNKQSVSTETIKMGFVGPLTGTAASYGTIPKQAMELALGEVNQEGGIKGRQLQIVFEDDQADPKQAVAIMQKFINIDKLPIVFSISSGSSLAIAPLAEQAKIILFSPAAAHPDYSNVGDYVFRNRPSITLETKILAEFAIKKFEKIAILYSNKDPFPRMQQTFIEEFQGDRRKVLSVEAVEPETNDFRSQLTKIKAQNPEAILFLLHTPKENGLAMKQARELGIKFPFLSYVGIQNPEFIEISGNAGEGVIYSAFISYTSDEFVSKYQSKYEKEPGLFAAEAYDAVKILASIMNECEINTECIKNTLYKIKDYPGASGITTFDENGDVIKPVMIKTVKNGQFVPLENF